MLPLVTALLEAGVNVVVASTPSMREDIERVGAKFAPAEPDASPAELEAVRAAAASLEPSEIRPFYFRRFADEDVAARRPGIERIVDELRPDVVIHEASELASPLVCTVRDIPYATHSYGPVLAPDVVDAAAAGAAAHWRAAGLDPHPRAGLWEHAYLDVWPASLQSLAPTGAPVVQPLRTLEVGPRRPARARRLVYITMGTVFNKNVEVFSAMLDGLRQLDIDVVVTVGRDGDPVALGPQPGNVRVERFVPQSDILPTCSVVITHGGAGSTLGALAHGCPVLFIPQGADNFVNATAVARSGAGVVLENELTADIVHQAVGNLLDDRDARIAAAALRDELAAMPGPRGATATLAALAQGRNQRP